MWKINPAKVLANKINLTSKDDLLTFSPVKNLSFSDHNLVTGQMEKSIKFLIATVSFFLLIFTFIACNSSNNHKESTELPKVSITTENGAEITSKEVYIAATVSISNVKDEWLLDEVEAGVRGRGNTSWEEPKKPYRIKFKSKQEIFGHAKAKSWTLIANYCDKSLSRNYLAYTLASKMDGIEFSSMAEFVDLYLNGRYLGVYLLCDQIEVGEGRINVEEESSDIDTGYLLEMNFRAPMEGELDWDYFFAKDLFPAYTIKSPATDEDYYSQEQLYYIKDYLSNAYAAILSRDMQAIHQYIDINSFIDCYIVHELFCSVDVPFSSFYLYKKKNGVLYAGPVWDFDRSSGNVNYGPGQKESQSPRAALWVAKTNPWYQALLDVPEIKTILQKRLADAQLNIAEIIAECDTLATTHNKSFQKNFVKWPIMGEYVAPNPDDVVAIKTVKGQLAFLKDWLTARNQYMLMMYDVSID